MQSSQDRQFAVGLDFGTTNSSIAIAGGGSGTELIAFAAARNRAAAGGTTFSYRSVLYLDQVKEAGRTRTHSWSGPAAIEHYLDGEGRGRFIQSLKSHLSSRSLTGTAIFGRNYTLETLIARILADLRIAAERQLGAPVRAAIVGRPVRFVGAETHADDAFAFGSAARGVRDGGV